MPQAIITIESEADDVGDIVNVNVQLDPVPAEGQTLDQMPFTHQLASAVLGALDNLLVALNEVEAAPEGSQS